MKPIRVLVLVDAAYVPPESTEGLTEKDVAACKTEQDVVVGIKNLGHEARVLGVASELGPIRELIQDWKPHVVFNLLEEFRGQGYGKKMVQAALEEAKKERCYKVICTSRYGREHVHKMYQDLGFKDYGKEFRIDIG